MLLQAPLRVVTPTVDGDVLAVLARADDWFTVARLRQVIGSWSAEGIRKALRRLEGEGIVETQHAGRALLYRLNRDHLAAGPVVALAHLREAFVDRLRSHLLGWPEPPAYAALFGSAARGDMSAGSDIDVFLLRGDGRGDGWEERVAALGLLASRWTGADVRVLEFGEAEVRGAVRAEPVLRDIVAEGVVILGEPARLRRLIGAG